MAAASGPAGEGRGPFCAGRSRPHAPRPAPSAAAPGPSGVACAPRPGPGRAGGRASSGPRCRGAETRPGAAASVSSAWRFSQTGPRASGTATTRGAPVAAAWGAGFHLPRSARYGGWGGRKMSVLSPRCQAHLFLFSWVFGPGSSQRFFWCCASSQLPPHSRSGDYGDKGHSDFLALKVSFPMRWYPPMPLWGRGSLDAVSVIDLTPLQDLSPSPKETRWLYLRRF